jgi:ankyrin repeat protein
VTFEELHRRIKSADIVALRHELEQGLDPNFSNRFGWSVLMLAALEGTVHIGELLISKGADPDRTNNFGETALSLAAHGGHIPFVEMLIRKGASTECHPHGHSMEDWIRNTSGLPKNRIDLILGLLAEARPSPASE